MKRFLSLPIFFSLLAAPLFAAAPWGLLETVEKDQKTGRYTTLGLINEIAAGTEITYCIDGDLPQYPADTYGPAIPRALNNWLQKTMLYIKQSGRGAEFADLEEILLRPVKLRAVPCACNLNDNPAVANGSGSASYKCADSRPMLQVVFGAKGVSASNNAKDAVGSCRLDEGRYHVIFVDMDDVWLNTLEHELGHALGLGDQYKKALGNSIAEAGLYDNAPSIMNGATDIQCDDAEGIINLIDCFRKPPAQVLHRGGDNGWQSICKGREKINYAQCLAKGRPDYQAYNRDGSEYSFYSYDKKGRLKKTKKMGVADAADSYDIYNKNTYKKVQRDDKGRLAYIKDDRGVETYFEYTPRGFNYKSFGKELFDIDKKPKRKVLADTKVVYTSSTGRDALQITRGFQADSGEKLFVTFFETFVFLSKEYTINGENSDVFTNRELVTVSQAGDVFYLKQNNFAGDDIFNFTTSVFIPKARGGQKLPLICKELKGYAACKSIKLDADNKIISVVDYYDEGVLRTFSAPSLSAPDWLKARQNYLAAPGSVESLEVDKALKEEVDFLTSYDAAGKLKQQALFFKQFNFSNLKNDEEKKEALRRGFLNIETGGERKTRKMMEGYIQQRKKELRKEFE